MHTNRNQIINIIDDERNKYHYNRFQLNIKIRCVKLSEHNELIYKTFHLTSKIKNINERPLKIILNELDHQLLERESNILLEGSGWSISRVENMHEFMFF